MRTLVFLVILLIGGCSNDVANVSFELDTSPGVETHVGVPERDMPQVSYVPDVEMFPLDQEVCQCEWDSWEYNGLFCLGIVCNEYCSPEVVACNERKQACVPLM